jgi:hypothetical protein
LEVTGSHSLCFVGFARPQVSKQLPIWEEWIVFDGSVTKDIAPTVRL